MSVGQEEQQNYTVTINTKTISLAPITLFNIAIECYCDGYSFSQDLSQMFVSFDDKQNAQDFLLIVQLHPRKPALPDKAKPLTKIKKIIDRKSPKK